MTLRDLLHFHTFRERAAHYRQNPHHFWIDLALATTVVLLSIVVISLYVINHTKTTNIVDFKVDYKAEELVNGQRVKFTVNYANTSKKITVHDAFVNIKFPDGLHEIDVDHPNYNKLEQFVFLGVLTPGASGSFDVTGLALSNLGEKQKFLFVLNYTNDSGLAQQEYTTREFTIDKSIVEMSLQLPEVILLGSNFTSVVKLKNHNDNFQNLKIKLDYPETYRPQTDGDTLIEKLDSGQELSKESSGSLGARVAQTEPDFTASLIYNYQDKDYVLSKTTTKAKVRASKFIISFADTDKNQNLNPGDQSEATIRFENGEDYDLKDLKVKLNLSGNYLDKKFMAETYGAAFNDFLLDLTDKVGGLKAGETKNITVKVAALPFLYVKEENAGPQSITLTAQADFTAPDSNQMLQLNSSSLEIPINSVLTMKSSAVFYTKEGDQIGVGSIPPRPGEFTAYWVILELTNGANKARNVTVTADLPEGAEYDEIFNVTEGAPIRKTSTGLEWYIPELVAYDGILSAAPQARIQIAVVPGDNQVGQILPLLKNIRVTAVDDRTAFKLSASAKDVTTAIFPEAEKNKVAK